MIDYSKISFGVTSPLGAKYLDVNSALEIIQNIRKYNCHMFLEYDDYVLNISRAGDQILAGVTLFTEEDKQLCEFIRIKFGAYSVVINSVISLEKLLLVIQKFDRCKIFQ